MKKSQKILSVFFSLVLLLGAVCPAVYAEGDPGLKFGDDGKFRIMHITDTHFTDCPFEEAIAFIEAALDDYKPDLVVFGGDNIKGWFDTSMQLGVKTAIDSLVAPLEERGIPFAYTYGNHDWQTYLCPKVLQNGFYQLHPNCIKPETNGTPFRAGDGYILVKDSAGENNILNLWLFDSGTILELGDDEYVEGVNALQLGWYKKACDKVASENGGRVIPSLVFQHFPVWEISKIFDEAENGVSSGNKKYALKSEFTDGITAGVPGRANDRITTHLNKSADIPTDNSGEYAAWVAKGDVFGAFFGHSHVNDYCGITEDGIVLGATMSAGGFNISSRFNDADGNPVEARGLRVIELDEEALTNGGSPVDSMTTYSVYYSDYFDGSVEKYPSKYKKLDEHDFGEWILLELEYFVKLIADILFANL